jgi:cation diffusion facilitator CzcD-associated flavoprotein CzcO
VQASPRFGRLVPRASAQHGAARKLGSATSAFPNLFMMLGPNTVLGHNSTVFMIEAQTRYVVGAIGGRPHRHAVAGYDCLPLVADEAIQAR